MIQRKTALIVGSGWQILRFGLVMLSAVLYVNPQFAVGTSLLLLMPASGSLLLCVAFLLAGLYKKRYVSLRGFLLLGKALEIVPGIALLVLQGGALFFNVASPVFDVVRFIDEATGYRAITEVLFYYGLACVVLVDLIFLLILLSYKTEKEESEPVVGENLPDFDITQIEEE